MQAAEIAFGVLLCKRLNKYSQTTQALPGISSKETMNTFVLQVIESMRRIRFVVQLPTRSISPVRMDPNSEIFDPLRASVLKYQAGDFDEACWLVFLFTHFGKNARSGYRLIRDVYGRLGTGPKWTWRLLSNDPLEFRHWLEKSQALLKSDRLHRGFGNHRKYQSLSAWKKNGTGAAVESYVKWVKSMGGHQALFMSALQEVDGDPESAFALLYRRMSVVESFGRTAKFDYLTMIGKLKLADLQANSVYFQAATGPVLGAKLMFYGSKAAPVSSSKLEALADGLAATLGIDKQVMEDSLCNWQKSPEELAHFRG
jgi:hypothetical protein